MTKSEIVIALAEKSNVTQAAARQFYEAFNEAVIQGLRDEQMVKIKGLGTFKTVSVKARKSVSVNGGEEIEIPAHEKVAFTAEKAFAERVNEPLAHLTVVDMDSTVNDHSDEAAEEDPQTEPVDDYKISMRMKKLDEDAEALKGLLAEINGQPEPIQQPVSESTQKQTAEPQPNSTPAVEQEPAPAPPNFEPEPAPAPPVYERQPIKNAPAEDNIETTKITHGGLLGRIFLSILLLLLIAFIVVYWVRFEGVESDKKSEPEPTHRESEPVNKRYIVNGSFDMEFNDDVKREVTETAPSETTQEPTTAPQPKTQSGIDILRSIKVDYTQIKSTETVRDGSRLTMISLRAYGDKRFWIYIYLANRDQLHSPGEIQTGMVIKIPKMDSRLTDASNPDCLRLAKEMEERYVK